MSTMELSAGLDSESKRHEAKHGEYPNGLDSDSESKRHEVRLGVFVKRISSMTRRNCIPFKKSSTQNSSKKCVN